MTTQTMTRGEPEVQASKPETDDVTLWSVTSILNALDKPALLYWAAEQTAKAAIASARSLPARVEEEGEDAVVKWLRDARFRSRKDELSAAQLGTTVHGLAERWVLDGARPDTDVIESDIRHHVQIEGDALATEVVTVSAMLDHFGGFLDEFAPGFEAAELAVYSPTYGYAGTLDGIATIGGRRVVYDIKTTRKVTDSRGNPSGPYPEVALQLAAYRHAELAATWRPRRYERFRRRYYLLSATEQAASVPVPETDGAVVIHVSPAALTVRPVRTDTEVFRAFLHTIEIARWSQQTSSTVIGDPLVPEEA